MYGGSINIMVFWLPFVDEEDQQFKIAVLIDFRLYIMSFATSLYSLTEIQKLKEKTIQSIKILVWNSDQIILGIKPLLRL